MDHLAPEVVDSCVSLHIGTYQNHKYNRKSLKLIYITNVKRQVLISVDTPIISYNLIWKSYLSKQETSYITSKIKTTRKAFQLAYFSRFMVQATVVKYLQGIH